MRYGTFDDEHREYVIHRPDTPASWVNYLGVGDYCGIISNNAAGYGFHRSASRARLTRFRFNSVPTDRPGRYVYLRDEDDGDYWSATWQPVGKPLDAYRCECRHGLGYTRFAGEYAGIRTRFRVFVPVDEPVEVWEVEVENASDRPRELSLFAYVEWCFWEMRQDLTNFQYILYTCRMGFADDTVDYSIRLWPFREPKGFLTSVLPVTSFDTDRDAFVGRYRHEGQPAAVERGECFGSIALGGTPCGAVQNRIRLAPGQTRRAAYVVGVGDAKALGRQCRAKYADPAAAEAELARLRNYWDERLRRFRCRTPSPELNSMVNVWNAAQCHTTFHWSRSASFNEAGGRDGLGYRDSHQDTLGVVHAVPAAVRARLVQLLGAQHAQGSAMHHVPPGELEPGPGNVQDRIYSDDHLWCLLSVPAYLKETGDFALLDERVPYADAGAGPVWEHLVRALEFSWSHRGPHGLCLGLAADWNDCLNLTGNGESTFTTFLFCRGLREMMALAERLGRGEDKARFGAWWMAMDEAVRTHAWDGQWFLRGYLDDGRKIGARDSRQATLFLNAQTWAVICGAGTNPDWWRGGMDRVHERLATEHGVVLNDPAYREHDALIGAVTCFPPGLKENGGIFCHAATWSVLAEGMLGRGDEAFRLYRSFLPAAKGDAADLYAAEPYVYAQFITGKEHPYHFGRARNSWLTGTAAWAFAAVTQYLLGVRADYDGLVVDPSIPSEWDGFEAERVYRGATYRIRVTNPAHVCHGVVSVTAAGRPVEGTLLPVAGAGETVDVEVVLGTEP